MMTCQVEFDQQIVLRYPYKGPYQMLNRCVRAGSDIDISWGLLMDGPNNHS